MQPSPSGKPEARGVRGLKPSPPPQVTVGKGGRGWVIGGTMALIAAGGVAAYQYLTSRTATPTEERAAVAVRTVAARKGVLVRTVRVTGATSAEKFASLIVPQMRGSRSFGGFGSGRSGGGSMSGRSSASSGGSSSGAFASGGGSGSSASGGSSSRNASSGSGSAGAFGAIGTADAAGGSSVAGAPGTPAIRTVRGASGRASAARSSGGSRASSRTPSAGLDADALGSTAASLPGGSQGPPSPGSLSGGGGGSSSFTMILQTLVKPGSMVRKGDVVAEFDRQYMLNRLDDYKATVITAEANFKRLLAQLEVTRQAHQQSIEVAKGAVAKAELDMKTVPVRSAIETERLRLALEEAQARYQQLLAEVKFVDIGFKAQVRDAELELESTRLELRRAEANAERMITRAPIDGLTVMQTTFRGTEFSQIQAGDQLYPGQVFMQVVDPSSMVINAVVNQVDVEGVRIGNRAEVRFDAYPDLQLPARVVSIGAITKTGGFRSTFVKEVPVRLKLERMDPRVIPDLSVSADVVLETSAEGTVLSREAIFREGGKAFVYVRNGQVWDRREVTLGLGNHLDVIVESGVAPGEAVAAEQPPRAGPEPPQAT